MSSATPSLALVRKHTDEATAVGMVAEMLDNLNEFLGVKPMSAQQIAMTAELIVSEFYWLKLADLKLVFRRAMTGHYGELYNSIDGAKICGWLRQYREERLAEAERAALLKHRNILKDSPEERDQAALERLAEFARAMMAKLNYTPKEDEEKPHFATLDQYLEHTGRDKSEFLRIFEAQARQEWEQGGTPFENFDGWLQYKKVQFLTNINQ